MNIMYSKMNVWQDKPVYDRAEKLYYEMLAKAARPKKTSLAGEVAKAREHIKQSLENVDDLRLSNPAYGNTEKRVEALEKGLEEMKITVNQIEKTLKEIMSKLPILNNRERTYQKLVK